MKNKPIIFFDGVCNLCNASVQFVLKHEKFAHYQFASLQSEFGQQFLESHQLDKSTFDSFVLFENETLYLKSDAALKVSKHLKFPFTILQIGFIFPSFIRNFVYDFVAKNRYKWFGKSEVCQMPTQKTKLRFIE